MNTFQSKYKVLEKIGEGSFSEVLRCEDRITGICYAAKRLKKPYKTEESITECAEIIAAQKVCFHPNILNMLEYHYDSFGGRVTFIFELMDMSMYDYLKTKRRGISEYRVRNYLYQILKGLEHLHKNGLFHRDVKPENILIKFPSILYAPLSQANCNEIIKLADLGSVRGIFSSPPYTEYISTRWYRSPECLLTVGNYGPKMDVWATGCVFYEMLTSRPLFPGTNEIDQLSKIHQILGSPSIQYLTKLKSRSRNCIFFPKLKGTGTDMLIPHVTRSGRNVLNLMTEYDWDKRINVKRLLKQTYFEDLQEKLEDSNVSGSLVKPKNRKKFGEGIKRSMGDDLSVSPIQNLVKNKMLKREHYSDEPGKKSSKQDSDDGRRGSKGSKGSTKSCSNKRNTIVKPNLTSSTEAPFYPHYKTNNNSSAKYFKVTSLPLVEYKVLRSFSGDATLPKKSSPNRAAKNKCAKSDRTGRFCKTSSNLESVKCQMNAKCASKKRFHSKSLVTP